MCHGEGVDEKCATSRQVMDEWCAICIDDLFERVILKYSDDDVIELRQAVVRGEGGLKDKR